MKRVLASQITEDQDVEAFFEEVHFQVAQDLITGDRFDFLTNEMGLSSEEIRGLRGLRVFAEGINEHLDFEKQLQLIELVDQCLDDGIEDFAQEVLAKGLVAVTFAYNGGVYRVIRFEFKPPYSCLHEWNENCSAGYNGEF